MPEELANYDAIILASGTRYGMMTAQLKNFLDQTGGLWMKGALVGKVGSAMTSSATQHGGQESTILGMHTVMLHHGLVIVGLPYAYQGQMGVDEIRGGSPYGASTVTAGDGSRQPSAQELEGGPLSGQARRGNRGQAGEVRRCTRRPLTVPREGAASGWLGACKRPSAYCSSYIQRRRQWHHRTRARD